eukprot:COSAG02_NODE_175_length_31226_cov_95.275934_20_plen_81_part_00
MIWASSRALSVKVSESSVSEYYYFVYSNMGHDCVVVISTWHETTHLLPLDTTPSLPHDAQTDVTAVAAEQREARVPEAVG